MADLVRANRVAIRTMGEDIVAVFYRTHKLLKEINSNNTTWNAPEQAVNKLMVRENFRLWIIENAAEFGIQYDPIDRRSAENTRTPKYETDDMLIKDAESMILPEMRALMDKVTVKYPDVEWAGVAHDEIVPMTKTGSGKELTSLGIVNGRYGKGEGNWAWAVVKFTVTIKYRGNECYIPVQMQLVSGQLKKTGIGITDFIAKVKTEIIEAGLATAEELDPPKTKESKADKAQDTKVEEPKQEVKTKKTHKQETAKEEKPAPKRQRRSKADKDAELAKAE